MDISSLVQTPASPTDQPTDQPTRKPYWQVLDEYRQFTNANRQFSDMSVPEFSQRMSAIHGDNSYDEGLTDNFARRAGANIEIGLRHFGRAEPAYPGGPTLASPTAALGGAPEYDLPKLAGQATEKAATALGASPETAKKVGAVGETLPSTALDVGVGALVGAATGGAGAIPTMAGLAGLQTYGETGRLAPSALSAGTTALFPKAAEVGGQMALKAVGGKALSELSPKLLALLPKETAAEVGSDLVPQGIGQTLARIGGAQAGMLGLGLASETAQTAIRPGETWQDKLKQVGEQFSPSSLAATAVGQLPFTALDLASARAHPIKALESQVKDNFAQRFTEAYKAESGGAEPTQDQISLAMQKLMEQKPVSTETPVGQALQSIAQTPVELDLKRPIQTTEGEWNVGDAIEATRAEAQNILRATPDVGDITQAHDLRLWAAVRAAQGEGAVSKQELARNAAERFVSGLRGDNQNLGRLSPDFARMEKDELVRQRNEKAQVATEAEITSKITPKLDDGTDNPLYDPALATKVALVSGDVGHRLDVGIEQPVIMATRGGETVPLNSSIINTVRGLVPKLGDERTTEVEALQKRIAEKDAEVEQIKKASGEELFDNPDLDHATGEAIQLRMMLDDLTGGKDLPVAGKTRAQQLTADATFAARRAALRYDKPFDLNNPQNVRDFYDYVKSAINTAERGWLRERMDQSIVTDAQGQAITFASRDAALARASVLNENVSEDEGTKYTVPESPRPDGTFHILRNRYFRTTSITPQETGSPEAVHEVGRGEIPFDEKTQADESTTGIPTATLDAVGATLKEIEREAITSRFRELAGLKDPAASEGRKAALAQNVIDFVSGLPDSTVARLMKEETGVSLREPALRKARFVKFMQFLRDGGDVKLAYDKTRPGLVKVKGEGNLDAMNDYFGDLGFANGRRFNERSKTSGMNFFEQFYVLSKLLQQEFVDPRSTASVETRPRGDFGWVPPGFKDQLDENKLTINWPKGYEKAVGVKQAQWADVPDAVKENAVIMRDREGNTKRFEVTKNPLQTMLVKGAKHDLLTSAGKLVEMISKFAPDVDPDQLQLLKGLTDASAFIRNLNVGFGIAKDPSVRGYFHTDDFSSSAGVLLSPFTQDVTGRNVASLMSPKDIVPHFLHELGHSATQFAYVRDPAFKAEVDKVYDYVKQHHDELMQFASGGKFSQSQLHGLTNPVEMLASVWHDADLQKFLKGVKDPFDPLPEQQSVNVPVTMFDRVMGLIRSVLRKLVGGDGANSMLARVSELAARGLEAQKGLDLQSRGDIYSQLYGRGNIESDVIRGGLPQPVPKVEEDNTVSTFLPDLRTTGQTLESRIAAGANFFYNLPEFSTDEKGQRRLGKVTIGRSGLIPVQALTNVKGYDGRQLSKTEVELYKQLVPEAFKGNEVDAPKLVEGLKTKGPVVEVKKLNDKQPFVVHEQQRLLHEIDTAIGPNWDEIEEGTPAWNAIPSEVQAKITRWRELDTMDLNEGPETGGFAKYQFISPKPESEMPGYVEGLVRLPSATRYEGRRDAPPGTYVGPHFGSEDTNVLAFFRGYEETLPDGTKAFHVIEVQSDWGQSVRDAKDRTQAARDRGITWEPGTAGAALEAKYKDAHPLLRVYESLALKAAIAHAKSVGADKVILSDAETAMMTEGHDRSHIRMGTSSEYPQPIQAPGMRLHYDQTLPSAMEKLTGDAGAEVKLGTHKAVYEPGYGIGEDYEQGQPPAGSPIFRDASGQPKTQITGRMYDIGEAPTGQTLTSRVNPSTVLDSLKSASTYVTEDGDKLWFKPFDDKYFRSTYQSAFGNKMLLKQEGGQWGYELPKSALENIGPKQLLQMPRPKVRTWAPSAFETMKDLFKRQGSNDQTAEALASYNLQFTALLKNSENAVWGKIEKPNDPSLLAMAWGKSRVGGLTPLSAENSQIAPTVMHEGAHLAGFNDVVDKYETPDVQAAVANANKTFDELSGAERRSVLEGLVRLSDQTKGLSMGVYPKAMEDPTEFAAEFMGHVGDALGQVPNPSAYLKDVLRFAPDEVSNVATKTTLRRFQALDRLKQLVKDQAASRGLKSDLSPVIDKLTDTFKQLSRNALDIAVDQAEFYRMRGLYPDLYREKLKQAAERLDNFANLQSDVEEPTPRLSGTIFQSRENDLSKTIRSFFTLPDNEGRLPTKPSMWDRTLMQFQQFAEKYPVARPFYDMLATEKGLARQRQIQLDTALAGAFEGAKAIDDKRTRQVVDFQRSQPLRDKFSKIALDINAYGDEKYRKALSAAEGDVFGVDPNAVTGFLTPEFVSGLMKKYGVSGKDLDAVNTVMTGTRNQIKLSSANIVGAKVASMERMLAEAIVRNTDLNPQAGREAAGLLSKAIQTQTTDFQGAQSALEEFTKTIPDANVRGRMFDFAQTSWEGIQRLERFLSLRMPYYMSERRPGQFGVFWKDAEDKVQSRYFADGKSRDAYVQSNNIDPVRTTNPGDKNFGVSEDVFDQLDQLHQRMMEKLAGMVGEKDAKELGPVMDLGSELRNALGARDVLNLTTPRKGAKGREDLDMFDVHQHYIRAVNQAIRARSVREEAQLLSQAPEFANEPLIKQQIQNHVDQVLAPDSQLGKAVVRVNQLYYLFGNVSSMIMQTSHQLMALAPKLTENGASVAGSYGTILKANKMVVDARLKGRYTDPEIQRMIDLAGTRGDIGSWISQEIDHNEDLQAINRIRGTSGKSLWEPFDLLKNKTYQAMNVMQKMYGVVPAYNSEVGFVTALLHLRKTQPNLKGDELYNEARFLKDVTLYPGGKETRPGFFQASGSNQTSSFVLPRSAAQTVWSLNTYANGLTTMMGNLLRKSFNPKGLTPAQATQVRKAAVQMFSTQIAVAGVLGLPFAQAMLYGLQQLFPDHNIEMGIRDTLAQLDGDGDAFGNLPSMLTTGIPSAMDYAPDLGSRFALAGTLHVSPYGGVGWQQLVGPVGGLVARLFHGVQAGARGEPMQTVQDLMPNGFQRLWKSLEQQNTYTSQSGKLLANDLRPEEVVARAIGFIPSRVSRIQDAERLSKITEDAEKSQQNQWASKQVGLMRQGRADEVRQNVAQRVSETQGARTAQELTGDVAREFERQTLPVDTRRLGSRATVLAQKSLKGVLGTQSNDVSNMQRLQTQQDILSQLGGKPIHVGQFRRAGAVDNLLQLYPHLTTPQAELLLAHSPASRPTPSLYEALTTAGE